MSTTVSPPGAWALRVAGLVAIAAALAALVADLALSSTANPSYLLASDYRYLLDASAWRLPFGLYLSLLAIPLEGAGYWLAYRALRPAGRWLAAPVPLFGASTLVASLASHGMLAPLALVAQARQGADIASYRTLTRLLAQAAQLMQPLGAVVVFGLLACSLWYASVLTLRPALLPRWYAFLNPITALIALIVLIVLVQPLAPALIPGAFDLASAFFFLALTLALWNGGRASGALGGHRDPQAGQPARDFVAHLGAEPWPVETP